MKIKIKKFNLENSLLEKIIKYKLLLILDKDGIMNEVNKKVENDYFKSSIKLILFDKNVTKIKLKEIYGYTKYDIKYLIASLKLNCTVKKLILTCNFLN